MKLARRGFTLIEILIVVAIIAILASVVLVGLGPTQSLGRDARRISDLHEVQNGLELYYNAKGAYPIPTAGWGPQQTANTLAAMLTGGGVGINSIPDDPSGGNTHYIYAWSADGAAYELAGNLENGTGGEWNNYNAPLNFVAAGETSGGAAPTCTQAKNQYCLTL